MVQMLHISNVLLHKYDDDGILIFESIPTIDECGVPLGYISEERGKN